MKKYPNDIESLPEANFSFFNTLLKGTAGIHLWLLGGQRCVSYLDNHVTPEFLDHYASNEDNECISVELENTFTDIIEDTVEESGVIVLVDEDRAGTWQRIPSYHPERRQFAYYLSRQQYDLHISGIDTLYGDIAGILKPFWPPPNQWPLATILHFSFAKFICDELTPLIIESR